MLSRVPNMSGYGHVLLNICRFFNVVGLLAAMIACTIILARTNARDVSWWFFDDASYLFTAISAIFLLLSELPAFDFLKRYFETSWPVLSPAHGLSWLAIFMTAIGFHVLGAAYNPRRDLTGSYGSAVLAGGFLCFVAAAITFIASCFFRDPQAGVNARNIRSDGKLAASSSSSKLSSHTDTYSFRCDSLRSRRSPPTSTTPAAGRTSMIGKIFLKLLHARANRSEKTTIRKPYQSRIRDMISAPIQTADLESGPDPSERVSPIVPGLRRPDTALHPMHYPAAREDPPYRYSEASYLNRF